MPIINQYDVFTLTKDLNPVMVKGMPGVILEVWAPGVFEVEFVKQDGTNLTYEGQSTFTVDESFIGEITFTNRN